MSSYPAQPTAQKETDVIHAKRPGALIALGLLNMCGMALAAPVTWHSDAMGTSMELSFNHSNLIEVPLILGTVTAVATIDDANLTKSTLRITADLTGLLSYNERWPQELRSDEFFAATTHPGITFTSRRIVRTARGYKVSGDLDMRGVSRPANFALSCSNILTYEGRQFRGITLTGKINWHDFGMSHEDEPQLRDNPEFGSQLELKINVELTHAPPP
jgi:polyisoprenoid-binding protein YceI